MKQQEDLAQMVRAGDHDRFLCIQLAPAAKREALYAITAFHIELAKIAETVSEPMIGQIRLAWWREALEEIIAGGAPRSHPVALALGKIYNDYTSVFTSLLAMVEGRAADLDETLIADEASWLGYLDATAGALHMAWAQVLDATLAAEYAADIAAQARAYAVVGLVRAVPYMAQQGFLRFAPEHIAQAGLTSLAPSAQLQAFVQMLLDTYGPQKPVTKLLLALRSLNGLSALSVLRMNRIVKQKGNVYSLPDSRLSAVLRIIQMNYF